MGMMVVVGRVVAAIAVERVDTTPRGRLRLGHTFCCSSARRVTVAEEFNGTNTSFIYLPYLIVLVVFPLIPPDCIVCIHTEFPLCSGAESAETSLLQRALRRDERGADSSNCNSARPF